MDADPALQRKILTLCLIHDGNGQLLLGKKKRGFGAGRWNGFGGKIEAGETVEAAARREVQEECGLVVSSLQHRAVLEFVFEGDPVMLETHLFEATDFSGDVVETEEMFPQWFSLNSVPFDQMWPDDRYWFPHFFESSAFFRGQFFFDARSKLVSHELVEVEAIPA